MSKAASWSQSNSKQYAGRVNSIKYTTQNILWHITGILSKHTQGIKYSFSNNDN